MESFGIDTFIDRLRTEFSILVASQDTDTAFEQVYTLNAYGQCSGIWR